MGTIYITPINHLNMKKPDYVLQVLVWMAAVMVVIMFLTSCTTTRYPQPYKYKAPKQYRCVVGRVNLWKN